MIAVIRDKRDALDALCRKFSVERLELFGSATDTSNVTPHDLDFLVRFAPCSPAEHYDRYFGFREELEGLFDISIDLVEMDALRNPYFIRRVNESRHVIYGA